MHAADLLARYGRALARDLWSHADESGSACRCIGWVVVPVSSGSGGRETMVSFKMLEARACSH